MPQAQEILCSFGKVWHTFECLVHGVKVAVLFLMARLQTRLESPNMPHELQPFVDRTFLAALQGRQQSQKSQRLQAKCCADE